MAVNDKLITVDGSTVHYLEAGAERKKVILLLHGAYGSAWAQWAEILPVLGETHRVIAPDLPDFGQSDALSKLDINAYVAWVKGLLDALEIKKAVLVGNSFAGLIARLFAAQYPQRTHALVLVNGGVIPAVPGLGKVLARIPMLGKWMYNRLARRMVSPGQLDLAIKTEGIVDEAWLANMQNNAQALGRLMRSLSISRLPDNVTPTCPTLLLWGEEDAITPRVVGEHIRDNIPNAKLSLVAAVGHVPHRETPEVFIGQIQAFLRDIGRPPGDGGPRRIQPPVNS